MGAAKNMLLFNLIVVGLLAGCREKDEIAPDVPPAHQPNWQDTLTMLTGPYSGRFVEWFEPGPGPYTSTTVDTVIVLQPSTEAPGLFMVGNLDYHSTIQRDLRISSPVGSWFFSGQMEIHNDSLVLRFNWMRQSPGSQRGKYFRGTKLR